MRKIASLSGSFCSMLISKICYGHACVEVNATPHVMEKAWRSRRVFSCANDVFCVSELLSKRGLRDVMLLKTMMPDPFFRPGVLHAEHQEIMMG